MTTGVTYIIEWYANTFTFGSSCRVDDIFYLKQNVS